MRDSNILIILQQQLTRKKYFKIQEDYIIFLIEIDLFSVKILFPKKKKKMSTIQ